MYKIIIEDNNGNKEVYRNCGSDLGKAENELINAVSDTISNFDEYQGADIDHIIDRQYENYGGGVIYIEDNGISPL